MSRVFNCQSRLSILGGEQRRRGQFRGKTVQCHRLKMVLGHDAGRDSLCPVCRKRRCDVDGLNLGMLEQLLGLPGAIVRA